jgi:hypothetical protein
MIPLGGHDLCILKGRHSGLPTLEDPSFARTLSD